MKVFFKNLICAALCLFSINVNAADADADTPATSMQRALDPVNIAAPGTIPFYVKAKFLIPKTKGGKAEGSFELQWHSPDAWRRTYELLGHTDRVRSKWRQDLGKARLKVRPSGDYTSRKII